MRPYFLALAMVAMLGIGIVIGCLFTHPAKADTTGNGVGHFQVVAVPGYSYAGNPVAGSYVIIDTTNGAERTGRFPQ